MGKLGLYIRAPVSLMITAEPLKQRSSETDRVNKRNLTLKCQQIGVSAFYLVFFLFSVFFALFIKFLNEHKTLFSALVANMEFLSYGRDCPKTALCESYLEDWNAIEARMLNI